MNSPELIDALINALAQLGEKDGQEDQERLWRNGTPAEKLGVLEARARHPETRQAGIEAALQDPDTKERAEQLQHEVPPTPVPVDELLKQLDTANPALFALCPDKERLREELRKRDVPWPMAWCRDPHLRPDLETLLYADEERYVIPAIVGLELLNAKDMIHTFRAMLDPGPPPEETDYDEGAIEE